MKNILFVITLLSISCNQERKFDRELWDVQDDIHSYPYRDAMLDDLFQKHTLVGIRFKELVKIIGTPNNDLNYHIYDDYGSDIDPIESKNLSFSLNSDSIVIRMTLSLWDKKGTKILKEQEFDLKYEQSR
jgi:hypothetical protein